MKKVTNLSIIVAVTTNNAIGRNGQLLFRLSDDMKFFRKTTMDHPVIMGRKTWESLPAGALPGRRNIVVSRNPSFIADNAEVVDSIDKALELVRDCEEAFIIGGAQIYAGVLPLASKLYLTLIDSNVTDADAFFPTLDPTEWREETPTSPTLTDPKTGVNFRFVCLSRK
ncbi:MAG: dihydrofolate reductase [Muribaculaceae bacterium]|nr:dihydrofolate reductase [Muribaculaceae bacterium]